jgi:transcriptional regulator with XRE-family HTH domain
MTHPIPLIPQFDEELRSTMELPLTVSSSYLLSELSDKTYRDSYVAAQIRIGLPFQVKALRTARNWSQGELAERARMAQPRISEIERPGERNLNIDTLLRLASAFDCALSVSFVPFSELVTSAESFDPGTFNVPTFQQELDFGSFSQTVFPSVVYFGKALIAHDVIVRPNEIVEAHTSLSFNIWAFPVPVSNTIRAVGIQE